MQFFIKNESLQIVRQFFVDFATVYKFVFSARVAKNKSLATLQYSSMFMEVKMKEKIRTSRKHSLLLTLEVDGLPPTVNHMYRNARGRRFRTEECREYQQRIVEELTSHWHGVPFEGRLALIISFTTKDRRRWDIDNRLKALQDCLEMAGIIKDDSQIDFISVERVHGRANRTSLTLAVI